MSFFLKKIHEQILQMEKLWIIAANNLEVIDKLILIIYKKTLKTFLNKNNIIKINRKERNKFLVNN